MKLAIVVDSSCGLTEKQAKKRGWHFLPLYLTIDGKEYRDGIDISVNNFLKIYKENSVSKTSCTPIGEALQIIEKLSKENDFVVIYPISMGLSSQQKNLTMIASEFKNVFVVKSKNVCQLIVKDLVELEKDVLSNELTIKQAIARIENQDFENNIPILLYPKDIQVLVRGGRLSPSAAKLAKLLRIFPVIGFQDGNLEKFDKGVTFNKTFINTTSDHYKKMLKKKINALMFLDTANPISEELFEELRKKVDYKGPIIRYSIPPIIAVHTGYGAMSVFYTRLEKDYKEYQFEDQKQQDNK